MWKAIFVMFVTLLFLSPVYAQEMLVKEVMYVDGTREAVIEVRQTGDVWTVREGDAVGEWRVIEITDALVTIEKMTGPSEALRAQIPVRGANTPPLQPSP